MPSVLGLERVLKYNFQYTAENLHAYLVTRAPTLSKKIGTRTLEVFDEVGPRSKKNSRICHQEGGDSFSTIFIQLLKTLLVLSRFERALF